MATKQKTNNATVVDKCTQRLTALKAYVAPTATIFIDGVSHTAADVEGIYQTCLDSRAALATARAEVKPLMAKRATAEAARRAADRNLKPYVIAQFGPDSKQAIDFGFPPRKKTARTVEQKAQAVDLALATRKARHTMGSKQKAEIKGTLPQPPPAVTPAPTATDHVATVTTTTTVAQAPSLSNGTPAPQPHS